MDVIFSCPNCKVQLEAESGMSGSSINCPACNAQLVIPEPDPANIKASSIQPHEEKHFVVPVSESPTQSLIEKPLPPLDVAAKRDGKKSMQVKTIRHSDCVEVGKDKFDDTVSQFLQRVGDENIVNLSTFTYSHIDLGSREWITDYGILIVYRA